MTPAPDYADIARRAAASGIMVTAAGVEEIAAMLATPAEALANEFAPLTNSALRSRVAKLEADLAEARKLVAERQVRIAKLTGALETQPPISLEAGSWFYPEGDTSSDECRFSVGEVIDYAAEGMAEGEKRVVVIERAVQLPDVYAAVHLLTEADKDARNSDDDVDFTLHATADAARAALSEKG